MKNPNVLKVVNMLNITANIAFFAILIFVLSMGPYAALAVVAFGFPVVVILAAASFVYNIIIASLGKIGGPLNKTLGIVSGIISILWLIGFCYFMANIGI